MSRMVQCVYLKKEAPAMAFQLYPGELGKRIFNEVSQEAWKLWQSKQTMLINEHKLNTMDAEHRAMLEEQMVGFLFEGKEVKIDGYVPQQK